MPGDERLLTGISKESSFTNSHQRLASAISQRDVVVSINRLLNRVAKERWIIGLQATSQTSICRFPERNGGLVTRRASSHGEGASGLADFLIPTDDGGASKNPPDRVGVVISNGFCRYLSIPWSDVLVASDGGIAYLQRAFAEDYGEVARTWEIVCQDAGYGQPRVACAVEKSLLQDIRSACVQKKLNLAFCKPYFDVALSCFRSQITAERGAFAVVEEDVLTIGSWAAGAIVEVDVEPCESDWPDVLAAWCARSALIDSRSTEVLVVCPPEWLGALDDEVGKRGWRVLDWPEGLMACVAENPAFALPVCAL